MSESFPCSSPCFFYSQYQVLKQKNALYFEFEDLGEPGLERKQQSDRKVSSVHALERQGAIGLNWGV